MFHPVFLFFDIGGGEIILIVLVGLLLFGGDKLPELMKGLGKGIRDFKDASEGVKREIQNQIDGYEDKKTEAPKPVETPAAETTVAEHTDATVTNPEPQPHVENHVPNTMSVGESHVIAHDDPDFVTDIPVREPVAEHHEVTPSTPEPSKEQHN